MTESRAAEWKLLQNVVLEGCSRNCGRGDDGQRDPNPFAVEEEEQLVVKDRTAQATAKWFTLAGLVIARSGVGEIVRGVQDCAIPEFVEIPVKLVGARFGDVVHLGGAIAALVDGVGKSVDGDFGNRVQSEHEVGGESAVEVGERIVGLESIDDVAVGECGQAVELHIAISVGAADEIVAAAGGVDERAGGELQRVSQISAGVRKVFQSGGIQIGGSVGIFRVDERRLGTNLDGFSGLCNFEVEADGLLLAEAGEDIVVLLGREASGLDSDGVSAWLQLGKVEAAGFVGCGFSRRAGLATCDRYDCAGNCGVGCV